MSTMSLCDNILESALQNVSACVEEAIREQQSGRPLSSIGLGGLHSPGGSYVENGEVHAQVAAVCHRTSRGALASSRLWGAQTAPTAAAAGLIGGGRIGVSHCKPAIRRTSTASQGSEVGFVSRR